jgi:hypothetical protein
MPDPKDLAARIQTPLAFNWWWGPGDPIPDPFLEALDRVIIRELATVYLELQANVLDARAKAARKAVEVVARQR